MHLKKEIVIANTAPTIILGFLLVFISLTSLWIFQNWVPTGSWRTYSYGGVFISGSLGIGAGLFLHEYYRYLMSKLLGLDSVLIKKPEIKVEIKNHVTKWQGIGIIQAPFIDLTLIALLIIVLINSWLITVGMITFLIINLMLSAKDIVASFLIYRYADPADVILFTQEGFQVWAIKNSDF